MQMQTFVKFLLNFLIQFSRYWYILLKIISLTHICIFLKNPCFWLISACLQKLFRIFLNCSDFLFYFRIQILMGQSWGSDRCFAPEGPVLANWIFEKSKQKSIKQTQATLCTPRRCWMSFKRTSVVLVLKMSHLQKKEVCGTRRLLTSLTMTTPRCRRRRCC